MAPVRITRSIAAAAALSGLLFLAGGVRAAGQEASGLFGVPQNTSALEGRPTVRVDTTEDGATRHILGEQEADASRLTIKVDDGRLYWGEEGRPLVATSSGEFIYLSSATEPGRYVRVRRLNDRFTYVEHVDKGSRAVTYWGELRIVLGK